MDPGLASSAAPDAAQAVRKVRAVGATEGDVQNLFAIMCKLCSLWIFRCVGCETCIALEATCPYIQKGLDRLYPECVGRWHSSSVDTIL